MVKPFRMTRQAQQVLLLLLQTPADELSGVEISEETGILSGSLYPLLHRLEDVGLLRARWEERRPQDLGRPRRRYYALTGEGANVAQAEIKLLTKFSGRPAWNS